MADCNTCNQYMSVEDILRRSIKCDANGNVAMQGGLLNGIELFKARVAADGGTLVSEVSAQSLYDALKDGNLLDESLIILPVAADKIGKIYSVRGSDFAFDRNCTKLVLNVSGILQTIAINQPPFHYTGGKYGLYIEQQRTNLFLYSEDFDNAIWTKTQIDLSNGVMSPRGDETALKITEKVDAGQAHFFSQTMTKPTAEATTYSFSIFIKRAVGSRSIRMTLNDGTTTNRAYAFYNTLTGEGLAPPVIQGTFTNVSTRSTLYADGWIRFELTATTGAEVLIQAQVVMADGTTGAYNGDGSSAFYIWGAQVSSGSAASSYMHTTSTRVTRLADIATIPVTNGAPYTFVYRLNGNVVVDYQANYAGASYQLPVGIITSWVAFNRQLTADEITYLTTNMP